MVDKDKWGIVYCPKGGFFGGFRSRWEKVEQSLKEHQIDYDMLQSENSMSVGRLVKMLINNGYKTIIIFGGDSALNDAVNCLMQEKKEIIDSIALGIIPNGVMNDFARYWGIEEDDIEKNIAWLAKRRVRKIDLGCIRYENRQKERCLRYFVNCVNFGLVATIMNLRKRTRHFFGSRRLSFIFSFFLLLFQRMEYRMYLKIHTDEIKSKLMTVCIGNALGYGQTPNAVPYNGQLDVSVVQHPKVAQVFEGMYLLMRGRFLNYKNVRPYRTKEVNLKVEPSTLISIDGRLMKHTPYEMCKVIVEKEVINFLIPC